MRTAFRQSQIIRNEVPKIRRALRAAESGLKFDRIDLKEKDVEIWAHPTSAPNGGWYLPTNIKKLNSFLGRWDFRGISVLDLGGGLGAASFILSLYFPRTAMIEADPSFLQGAERTKTRLGRPYDRVQVYCGDFLKLNRPFLKEFDLLYFFLPFAEDVPRLMGELMSKTHRGQTILTCQLTDNEMAREIFPEGAFARLKGQGLFVPFKRIAD